MVATGGVDPKIGATGFGYQWAEQFNLAVPRVQVCAAYLYRSDERFLCQPIRSVYRGRGVFWQKLFCRRAVIYPSRPERAINLADFLLLAKRDRYLYQPCSTSGYGQFSDHAEAGPAPRPSRCSGSFLPKRLAGQMADITAGNGGGENIAMGYWQMLAAS